MHTVDSGNHILIAGFDDAAVIHLINTDVCIGFANDMGNLPVGIEVPGTTGTDTELSHRNSGRLIGEQITGKTGGNFCLLDDSACNLFCICGVNCFDIQDPFGKTGFDFCFRNILFHAPADKAFDIHSIHTLSGDEIK